MSARSPHPRDKKSAPASLVDALKRVTHPPTI
jgi:hypothetical protein